MKGDKLSVRFAVKILYFKNVIATKHAVRCWLRLTGDYSRLPNNGPWSLIFFYGKNRYGRSLLGYGLLLFLGL